MLTTSKISIPAVLSLPQGKHESCEVTKRLACYSKS